MVAATSLVTPVEAGIHDFTPSRVQPVPSTSSSSGNCVETNDNSRLCYMNAGDGKYVLAINDTDYPSYPAAMVIICRTGRWRSYSQLPKTQLDVWARTFCRQQNS